MNGVDYDICETQQRIYEHMANLGYDMKKFSDAYLSSDFCSRAMDTIYSRFQLEDVGECSDFFMPEIESKLEKLPDNKQFDSEVAGWIGFTYRQLYIETKIKSNELIELVPFEAMCRYYPGLHTIDEDNAADIIIQNMSAKKAK